MNKRKLSFIFTFTLLFLTSLNTQSATALTWSSDERLTTNPTPDTAPSVIQTSDHRIWIVWERAVSPGRAIFYMTSSDYGISWSQEKNLTKVPSEDMNQDPSITQLSNGIVMVVWSAARTPPPEADFDLSATPAYLAIPRGSSNTSTIVVTSTAGYSDPVDLWVKSILPPSPFIHTDLTPPQVTPPPNGNATSTLSVTVDPDAALGNHTIIVNGRSESLGKTKTVNVELTVTAAAGSATSGSSHTAPLHISETEALQDYDIYYKVSHDNGTSWSRAIRLTQDTANDNGPSVLQASNGTIWVVWSSSRTGDYELFYKTSSNMGTSWSDDTQLTFDLEADAFPAIAEMHDGRIWVAWHSSRYFNNGGLEIFYKIYDGASWSSDERLTDTSKDVDDTSPAILQTANGTIWIFWASEGDYQPPFIFYQQSYDNGTTWSDTFELTEGLSTDVKPAATQTCDSKVWVVWASLRDADFELYYKASLVHNVAVTNVVPSETVVYREKNVTIDVMVQNYGDYTEAFTVNSYANSTLIGSELVNLASKSSDMVAFTWNTSSGTAPGTYTITANVSVVQGETDTADNTFIDGVIQIRIPGDADLNGFVELDDFYRWAENFGNTPDQYPPGVYPDFDDNGLVEMRDFYVWTRHWGET